MSMRTSRVTIRLAMTALVLMQTACGGSVRDTGTGGGDAGGTTSSTDSGTASSTGTASGTGTTSGTGSSSGNPAGCADYPGPASVTLGFGTQQTGFSAVEDGSEKAAELGPAGLYMYQLAIVAQGVNPGKAGRIGFCQADPLVETQIWLGMTQIGGSQPLCAGLTEKAESLELSGIFTPFDTLEGLAGLLGKTVTLRTIIKDVCNNSATDDLMVVVGQ